MLAVRSLSLATLCSLGACGFSINSGVDAATDTITDGSGADADLDAPPPVDAPADMTMATSWATPALVAGVSNANQPTLTADTLQIWFQRNGDIYHASRPNLASGFGAATVITELSLANVESSPEVAANGSSMTFTRFVGNNDVFISTFDSTGQTWTAGVSLNDINSIHQDQSATISEDRLMLAMVSSRISPYLTADLFISTRSATTTAWSEPVVQPELGSSAQEGGMFLSGDKLSACFDSQRSGVTSDIYCATRASASAPFSAPFAITEINSAGNDQDPWLTPDGKLIVFWSDRDGIGRLYYSTRP